MQEASRRRINPTPIEPASKTEDPISIFCHLLPGETCSSTKNSAVEFVPDPSCGSSYIAKMKLQSVLILMAVALVSALPAAPAKTPPGIKKLNNIGPFFLKGHGPNENLNAHATAVNHVDD
ncbi:hypothetical protein FQN57_005369 [Myotisia sp. PD_48]|nr:hypothetical protein FQN57_005369 [Myotisia sp. PD_48]